MLAVLVLGACGEEEPEGVNRRPVVGEVVASVDEDGVVEVDLLANANDPEGKALTLTAVTTPPGGHGTVVRSDGKVSVAPAANFHGTFELFFSVSDGRTVATGKATIIVRPINDAPRVMPVLTSAFEDSQRTLQLLGTDADGDMLTFSIVEQPAHGTVILTGSVLQYFPAPDYFGSDVIRYAAHDGTETSAAEKILVEVYNVNDAPVVAPQTLAATEDTESTFTLDATDSDGDSLSSSVVVAARHGTVGGTGLVRTYRPALNYHGTDEVTFSVFDGRESSLLRVSISVAPVDDAPVASPLSRTTSEDTAFAVVLQGIDVDGDALDYTITTPPGHGTLSGTAPNLTYTPHANYFGADSFDYVATSNGLSSAPARFSIAMSAVNDPPTPVSEAVTVAEDGSVSFTLSATDVDSTSLSYVSYSVPSDGVIGGVGRNRTYTPALNANGTRTYVFEVSDGRLSSLGTITLTITPSNDPPVANVDFVATEIGTAVEIPVLANDVDVDGDVLSLDDVGEPAHGQADIVDGKLRYTPEDGYEGTDHVTYQVVDAAGVPASAEVTIGVGGFPAGAPFQPLPFAIAGWPGGTGVGPSLSGDGRYVAFSTTQRLVSQDTNTREDVYLYERGRRAVRLVSADAAGVIGDALSGRARVSASGRYVVFESRATNLVPGGDAAAVDVFRKDLTTGEIVQISVTSGGVGGNGNSYDAQISDDGNRVVFTSLAFNLAAGDANGSSDVFLRDVAAGTTERLSVSRSGLDGDSTSDLAVISGDGAYVAFSSIATNLVDGDGNGKRDVFVRELAARTTSRVSLSSNGIEGDEASYSPSLSRDGRYVAFLTGASNFGPDDPGNTAHIYVRDRLSQTTIRPTASLTALAQLSGDGRYLCGGTSSSSTVLYDRFAGAGSAFTPPSGQIWTAATISGNGRYVAFVEYQSGAIIIYPNPR